MSDQGNQSTEWQYDDLGSNIPEAYERYLVPTLFAPWADRLVERVTPEEGDRVLDVACGTGIVARRAALSVGEDGTVVGIDSNEDMLEVARAVSSETQPAVEWRQEDAMDLPFPDDAFDVVFCQQSLQYVSEPPTALAEMHRVLAPEGRLALSVWRPIENSPGYAVMGEALGEWIDDEVEEMMRAPFPDWDKNTLRDFAREAGIQEMTVTIEIGSVRFPSIEEFLRRSTESSPLAEPVGSAGPEIREALVRDLDEALDEYTDDGGIVFPMETYVVSHGEGLG